MLVRKKSIFVSSCKQVALIVAFLFQFNEILCPALEILDKNGTDLLSVSLSSKPLCSVSENSDGFFDIEEFPDNGVIPLKRKWAIIGLGLIAGEILHMANDEELEDPQYMLLTRMEEYLSVEGKALFSMPHRGDIELNYSGKRLSSFKIKLRSQDKTDCEILCSLQPSGTRLSIGGDRYSYIGIRSSGSSVPPEIVESSLQNDLSEDRSDPPGESGVRQILSAKTGGRTEPNKGRKFQMDISRASRVAREILKIHSDKNTFKSKTGLIVCIDGYIGAGKTTFQDKLKKELGETPGVVFIHKDLVPSEQIRRQAEGVLSHGGIVIIEGLGSFSMVDSFENMERGYSIFITADIKTRLFHILKRSFVDMPFLAGMPVPATMPELIISRTLDYFMAVPIFLGHSMGALYGSIFTQIKTFFEIRKVSEKADVIIDTSPAKVMINPISSKKWPTFPGEGPGGPHISQSMDDPGNWKKDVVEVLEQVIEKPINKRHFIFGDIHGELAGFKYALRRAGLIDNEGNWVGGDQVLVQMGDMIDRGPRSLGALSFIRKLQQSAASSGGKVIRLIGNHELMFLRGMMGSREHLISWYLNGGDKICSSLGICIEEFEYDKIFSNEKLSFILWDMIDDIETGKLTAAYEVGGRVCVHAGIPPGIFRGLNPKEVAFQANSRLITAIEKYDFSDIIFRSERCDVYECGIFWGDYDLVLLPFIDDIKIRQIVAHTPQEKENSRVRYSGDPERTLINVDVGFAENYKSNRGYLVLEGEDGYITAFDKEVRRSGLGRPSFPGEGPGTPHIKQKMDADFSEPEIRLRRRTDHAGRFVFRNKRYMLFAEYANTDVYLVPNNGVSWDEGFSVLARSGDKIGEFAPGGNDKADRKIIVNFSNKFINTDIRDYFWPDKASLATVSARRNVDQTGRFLIGGERYYIGKSFIKEDVYVSADDSTAKNMAFTVYDVNGFAVARKEKNTDGINIILKTCRVWTKGKISIDKFHYYIGKEHVGKKVFCVAKNGLSWESSIVVFSEEGKYIGEFSHKEARFLLGSILSSSFKGTALGDLALLNGIEESTLYHIRKVTAEGKIIYGNKFYTLGSSYSGRKVFVIPNLKDAKKTGFKVIDENGLEIAGTNETTGDFQVNMHIVSRSKGAYFYYGKRKYFVDSSFLGEKLIVLEKGQADLPGQENENILFFSMEGYPVAMADPPEKHVIKTIPNRISSTFRKYLIASDIDIDSFERYYRASAELRNVTYLRSMERDIFIARSRYEGKSACEIGRSKEILALCGRTLSRQRVIQLESTRVKKVLSDIPKPLEEAMYGGILRDALRSLSQKRKKKSLPTKGISFPSLIAVGTGWMKSYNDKNSLQYNALNPLLSDIRTFCEKNGIVFISGEEKDLPKLISEKFKEFGLPAQDTHSLILAEVRQDAKRHRKYRIEKNLDDFRKSHICTFIGIDGSRYTRDGYIALSEMLLLGLNISTRKNFNAISKSIKIKLPDKTNDFYIFIPECLPVDDRMYKRIYNMQRYA